MTRMTTRIEEQLIAADAAIADLSEQLTAKKAEREKLSIALEVVRQMFKRGTDEPDDGQPGLRERILKCFEDGDTHTKDDIAKALNAEDPESPVKEATVGSLLSRYVGKDLEKIGRSGYRRLQNGEGSSAETGEPSSGAAP